MTIDDHNNRDTAKILTLSSGKTDNYEYVKCREVLPSYQRRVIEQATFTYYPIGIAFEKQIETIEDQGGNNKDP